MCVERERVIGSWIRCPLTFWRDLIVQRLGLAEKVLYSDNIIRLKAKKCIYIFKLFLDEEEEWRGEERSVNEMRYHLVCYKLIFKKSYKRQKYKIDM